MSNHKDWEIKPQDDVLTAVKSDKAIVVAAKAFTKGTGSLLKPSLEKGIWSDSANATAFKIYCWEGATAEAGAIASAIKADKSIAPLKDWVEGGPWAPKLKNCKQAVSGPGNALVQALAQILALVLAQVRPWPWH